MADHHRGWARGRSAGPLWAVLLSVLAVACGPKGGTSAVAGDDDDDWAGSTAAPVAPSVGDVGADLAAPLPERSYAPGAVAAIGFASARAAFTAGDYRTAAAGMRGVAEGAVTVTADEKAVALLYLVAAELRVDVRRAREEAKRAGSEGGDPAMVDAFAAMAAAAEAGRALPSSSDWDVVRELLELGDSAAALALASAAGGSAPDAALQSALEEAVDDLDFADLELVTPLLGGDAIAGWVRLRRAVMLYHVRRVDDSRRDLEAYLAGFPGHPGADRARALLGRISLREKVDRKKVGVLLPLSGGRELLGKEARTAIEIAFADSPYELVFKDTKGEETRGADLAEELAMAGVIAILGPIGSLSSRAAAAKAEEYGIPLISLALDPTINAYGSWIFRARVSREEQARAIARHAVEVNGVKRFGVLYPLDDYGTEMMRAFWDEVVRLGAEVVAVEGFLPGSVNPAEAARRLVGRGYGLAARSRDVALMRKELEDRYGTSTYAIKKLKEALPREIEPIVEFDALFIPESSHTLKFLLPHLNAVDIEFHLWPDRNADTLKKKHHGKVPRLVHLLGTSGWNSTMWAKKETEHLLKMVPNCTFVEVFFEGDDRPEAAEFVSRFGSVSKDKPSSLAAQAHDAAAVLLEALNAGAKGGRDGVRNALLRVRDFGGATGVITMRPNGSLDRTMVFLTIDDEGTVMTRKAYEEALAAKKETSSLPAPSPAPATTR